MHDARSGIPDSLQAGPTYSTNLSLLHPSMWPLLLPQLRDPLLIPECALSPAPTTTPTAPMSELHVLGVDHPPSSSVGSSSRKLHGPSHESSLVWWQLVFSPFLLCILGLHLCIHYGAWYIEGGTSVYPLSRNGRGEPRLFEPSTNCLFHDNLAHSTIGSGLLKNDCHSCLGISSLPSHISGVCLSPFSSDSRPPPPRPLTGPCGYHGP